MGMDDCLPSVQTPAPLGCHRLTCSLSRGLRSRREDRMKTLHCCRLGAISFASILAAAAAPANAQQTTPPQVAIDSDDIGGVVGSPSGPEAGVWVIAET